MHGSSQTRSVTVAVALFAVGCAHTRERVTTTEAVAAPVARTQPVPSATVETTDAELYVSATPPARPRLSKTVTLGAGQADASYSDPRAVVPPAQGGNTVVVNNNNTVVVQQPPVFYGYGGYGYGGFGGYGSSRAVRSDRGGWGSSNPSWGSSGWEGARRTAAPGQTPGVGGNWSPAPSYGPAPMR